MSRHTVVLRSLGLGSLWQDREGLERGGCLRRRRGATLLCTDRLVHNALYTGDLHRLRHLFTRGSALDLLIAQGEDAHPSPKPGCRNSRAVGASASHCTMANVIVTSKAEGPDWDLWQALLLGDAETVLVLITDPRHPQLHPNVVFDTSDVEQWKNYRYNLRALRIWSLCYRQEFTTPLQICSSRGYDQCVRHLLSCGAEPDFSPGGKTALHEACENAQAECVRLLLIAGANPNAVSEDGYSPLHLCSLPESLRCAEYLLEFGGHVNHRTEEKDDTALHIAARFGLEEHVDLYLRHGASINRMNNCGQTPLHCVCGQPHSKADVERYYQVCRRLVESGASVVALDEEQQSALHLACHTANHRMVDLLLAKGVDVNRMDYGGNAPLHKALQVVSYKLEHEPERTVQSLLNYGSIRIWPGAIPKVLRYCSQSPRTIEVLLNAYDRLKVTDEWARAIPKQVLQEHADFYRSLLSGLCTPRSLQHLTRCTIRAHCRGPCARCVPVLPLPPALKHFLLLQFQGCLV